MTLSAGARFIVFGAVDGNIYAPAGGLIISIGAIINGNIEGAPGTFVRIDGSTVNGNIAVTGAPQSVSRMILVGSFM